MTSLTLSVILQASILGAGPQAVADEYSQAYHQSASTGQPMMLLVGADWCPACVTMKSSVLPEVRRRGLLGKVAFATINTDRQSRLANQLMTGDGIPQLILFYRSENGWKRIQVNGSVSADTVKSFIDRGVAANVGVKDKPTATAAITATSSK